MSLFKFQSTAFWSKSSRLLEESCTSSATITFSVLLFIWKMSLNLAYCWRACSLLFAAKALVTAAIEGALELTFVDDLRLILAEGSNISLTSSEACSHAPASIVFTMWLGGPSSSSSSSAFGPSEMWKGPGCLCPLLCLTASAILELRWCELRFKLNDC